MGKFRQWIVRLFNIKAEDLPESSETVFSSKQINEKIQEEVNKQVRQQLQQSLQEIVIPEIQKTISVQISQSIQQISTQETKPSNTAEAGDVGQSQLLEPALQETEKTPIVDGLIKENPPIVEGSELQPIPSEVSSNNQELEEGEQETLDLSVAPITAAEELHQPEVVTSIEEEITPLETPIPATIAEVPSIPLHSVAEREIRIGIDFGTTTTAISIKIGDERPEAIPIGLDGTTRYMPSIVYIQPGSKEIAERAVVGEEAESYGDQAHIIRSVKRCFACQGGNCYANENGGKRLSEYPFPWCRGDGKIYITDIETTQPTQIAYLILREILSRAVKVVRDRWQIDLTTENVCFLPLNLGCGANFNLNRREMICSVAKDLGFRNVKIDNIVEEPILAGFTFSRFAEQPEGRALIYDFGGGTFDVAVLDVDRFENNLRVTVVATAGENWLGGDDIDSLVYNHFLHEAANEVGLSSNEVDDKLGSIDRSRLRLLARTAKEQLSATNNFSDVLLAQNLGPLNLDLTREKFEELLEGSGMIQKSLDAVERACKLAYAFENAMEGQTIDSSAITRHRINDAALKIDRVILVGGVTKTPLIRNKLTELFGRKKIVQETVIDPISAVAIGGAYPRDPQHYSICVPPFGFYLEYEYSTRPGKHYQIIFEPFEYYDFHKYWMAGPLAVYFKDIDVQIDYHDVKMCAKKVGGKEPLWIENLGNLSAGKWRFSISLEGNLYYSKVGESSRQIQGYPIIHPIQQAIRDARKQRQEQEQIKRAQSQGNYDDWIKGMMNEN